MVADKTHLRMREEGCGLEAHLLVDSFGVVVQWRQERQQLLELDQASATDASRADLGATMTPGQNGLSSSTWSTRTSERSRHILRMMDAVESQTSPVPMGGMTSAEQHGSRQLAYILAQALTGSSPQLVMNAEAYNGMEG